MTSCNFVTKFDTNESMEGSKNWNYFWNSITSAKLYKGHSYGEIQRIQLMTHSPGLYPSSKMHEYFFFNSMLLYSGAAFPNLFDTN